MVTMRLVLLFHECNGLFAIVLKDDNPDIFMGFDCDWFCGVFC